MHLFQKAHAVNGTGAISTQGLVMEGSAVALMLFKPILWILLGHGEHITVTRDFGKDGSRRDIGTLGIALDNTAGRKLNAGITITVNQDEIRLRIKPGDGAVHGEESCIEDIQGFNFFHRGKGDTIRQGRVDDNIVKLVPFFGGKLFGVIKAEDFELFEGGQAGGYRPADRGPGDGQVSQLSEVAEGVRYLNWSVPCYLLLGLTTVATCIIRNVGHVRLPLYTSIGAFFINIFFNWVFIFGKLGAPAMGIAGAALGTLISRVFECSVICGYMFFKDQVLAYRFRDLFEKCSDLLREFIKITVPSIVSDVLLGLGTSLTTAVGGRISQAFMSGNSITAVVQQGIIIFTSAMGQSSQIIIGNTLGEGRKEKTQTQAYTFMTIAFGLGILAGILIFALAPVILSGYHLSAGTQDVAMELLHAQALMAVVMIPASVGGKGILRGGGDVVRRCKRRGTFLSAAPVIKKEHPQRCPFFYFVSVARTDF